MTDLSADELRRLLETARRTSGRELSLEKLGKRFGIGADKVARLLRENGVERPKPFSRNARPTEGGA